jgi:hypothetical protein
MCGGLLGKRLVYAAVEVDAADGSVISTFGCSNARRTDPGGAIAANGHRGDEGRALRHDLCVRQHKPGRAVVQQSQRLRRELNSHEAAEPQDTTSCSKSGRFLSPSRRRTFRPVALVQLAEEAGPAASALPAIPRWRPRTPSHVFTPPGPLHAQIHRPAVAASAQRRGPQGSSARSGERNGQATRTKSRPHSTARPPRHSAA